MGLNTNAAIATYKANFVAKSGDYGLLLGGFPCIPLKPPYNPPIPCNLLIADASRMRMGDVNAAC